MTLQGVFQSVLDTIDNVSSILTFGALKNAEELKAIRQKKLNDKEHNNRGIRQSAK